HLADPQRTLGDRGDGAHDAASSACASRARGRAGARWGSAGAWDGRSSDTSAPTSEVAASTHRAVCMLAMNGASLASDSPCPRPEKIDSSVDLGTAEVTIASTNAIEITAPVFWSIVRAPAATPRRWAGTAPIIAAVLGLLNRPEPTPTTSSHSELCQYGEWACSVVIAASPAALTSMPSAASVRDPRRSAYTPASGEETSMPSASGISLMPAVIGPSPRGPGK